MSRTRVRRRRMVVTASLVLVGSAWAAPALEALGGESPAPVSSSTYVVRQGDSLWSIAGRLRPSQDPRAVVDALADANGIGGAHLEPGQVLVVPAG